MKPFFPDNPDAEFMFAPAYTGQLLLNKPIKIEGNCFADTTFELVKDASSPKKFQVKVTLEGARTKTCSDFYLFGNTEVFQPEEFFFRGTHYLNFISKGDDAAKDIEANGFETYLFCESGRDELLSLIQTLKSFIGGLGKHGKVPLFKPAVPEYMEKANKEFLKWAVNYDLVERPTQKVEIDEDLIQAGDYFAVMRLDGLDPIIMYGTGSHSGHSVVAHRENGKLYIVESQSGWYWPTDRIQKTLFKDWLQYAEAASFHVVHMPLRADIRAKFDIEKANAWFKTVQGLPYGYHNFLYGWVDTPEDNWPAILGKDLVPVAFGLVERINRNTTDIFFTSALNKKLGTEGLNISEIVVEAGKRGLNISEVMALTEVDGWKYTGEYHDGLSMVCSSFVVNYWKAAGLFDDVLPIYGQEWGPKDVYQVDFFEKNWDKPAACKAADPDTPWCQLLGKYRMTFPNFSAYKPYPNMNNKCPSLAPDFYRPDGC